MDWGVALGVIGIAIGVVALVVAVPPLIALIWGQPKIAAEFIQTQFGIACRISNVPIASRLLQVLGVTRREPEVYIGLFIKDAVGKIIVGPTNAVDQLNRNPGCTSILGIHLYPQFSIVSWRSAHAEKPEVCGDWSGERPSWGVIQEGNYTATVTVRDIASNRSFTFIRRFVVGPNPMETKWLAD